jgi:hypothetical protein
MRFCLPATSKIPPEITGSLGDFFDMGAQFGFDDHGIKKG